MAIRNYKPTTPGRRKMSALVNEEITTNVPEKSLVVTIKKNGGRNNQGKITVRHHGGGEKRCMQLLIHLYPFLSSPRLEAQICHLVLTDFFFIVV